MKKHLMPVAILTACTCLILSCGSDENPNMLPDTMLTVAPDQGSVHSYAVDMVWEGEDPDGIVEAYEIAWHDGMTYTSTIDSLEWDLVTVTDSTFAVSADTCPAAPQTTCWGSHTFFVRAVDDNGGRDDTPAMVSFTATTIIPRANIIRPPRLPEEFIVTLPTCVKVEWEGTDQDGEAVKFRYVAKPYDEWPYHEPPPQWSTSWSPWSSATEAVISLSSLGEDAYWSLYVQAMDNAGAIENVFQDRRNHILIEVNEALNSTPFVRICAARGSCSSGGTSVGCRSTDNPSQMAIPISIEVGDTLCFRAEFSPGSYATAVTHIAFALNDEIQPASWRDATKEANWIYPPSGIHLVQEFENTIYVWVKDDFCEFGSTAMAYIIIDGVE